MATTTYCTPELLDLVTGNLSNSSDALDDDLVGLAINAASRQIDAWCGQRFWVDDAVVARLFYVSGDGRSLNLWQGDVAGLATATGLVVETDTAGDGTYATALTVNSDFLLAPVNAATAARPYTQLQLGLSGATYSTLPLTASGRPVVRVTGKWGWPAVPADVQQACALQAAQLFKSKDAAFGVAGFGDLGVLRIKSAMHPIAEGLLAPYRAVVIA